jgi:acyl-CoA thioesterase I
MRAIRFLVSIIALASILGCGRAPNQDAAAVPKPSAPAARPESLPKIVAFGDSLTAGLGLTEHESYPALLQKMLDQDGYKYEVVNAGVSGDTSAGGVRRIDWAMDGDVRVVIVELGANDLLRGQPIPEMKKNLAAIIDTAKGRGAKVLLTGMYAPTNTGIDYQRQSQEAFQSLAREKGVILIPFFLDRVAGIESLNQADGIHPNPEGTRIVAETVYKSLKPMLDSR